MTSKDTLGDLYVCIYDIIIIRQNEIMYIEPNSKDTLRRPKLTVTYMTLLSLR